MKMLPCGLYRRNSGAWYCSTKSLNLWKTAFEWKLDLIFHIQNYTISILVALECLYTIRIIK